MAEEMKKYANFWVPELDMNNQEGSKGALNSQFIFDPNLIKKKRILHANELLNLCKARNVQTKTLKKWLFTARRMELKIAIDGYILPKATLQTTSGFSRSIWNY